MIPRMKVCVTNKKRNSRNCWQQQIFFHSVLSSDISRIRSYLKDESASNVSLSTCAVKRLLYSDTCNVRSGKNCKKLHKIHSIAGRHQSLRRFAVDAILYYRGERDILFKRTSAGNLATRCFPPTFLLRLILVTWKHYGVPATFLGSRNRGGLC